MSARPTVSAAWCKAEAERIKAAASEDLKTLAILGKTQRYFDDMVRADLLIRAASIRNIGERRHFLRSNGVAA